jgi:magnesium chelatase family protein
MHPSRFHALLNRGWRPELQCIEIATALQIPSFHIVGLPSPEIAESRERVRASIEAIGREFPRRRIVVNLSPASVRKQGTGIDLSLALAILAEDAELQGRRWVAWGELGLDGSLKAAGQLTRLALAAWEAQTEFLVIPREEQAALEGAIELIRDAGTCPGRAPEIIAASDLAEAWDAVRASSRGKSRSAPRSAPARAPSIGEPPPLLPLPPSLERVLGACAAGRHHLMLLGPRGTGKSQALEWLVRLTPRPSSRIRLIQATLSELADPFAPTHEAAPLVRRIGLDARPPALLGQLSGGTAQRAQLRPGEFSRAHGGLLLADEFPEWPRDSRETLREPLERGMVTLSRVAGTVELPADFQFAATGNLCPCGGWPPDAPKPEIPVRSCRCVPVRREDYLSRLSGPVLDRIDCLIRLLRPADAGAGTPDRTRGEKLTSEVARTRDVQLRVWGAPAGTLDPGTLERLIEEHPAWGDWLKRCAPTSLRSRHKTLRLALSLAAWDQLEAPNEGHFMEAASYRPERLGVGI